MLNLSAASLTKYMRGGMKKLCLFGVLASAPLFGCTSVAETQKISVAPSSASLASTLDTPYKLQVGDSLDIKFLMNPELDEQVVVRPDGRISTVVAQDIAAYGLSPAELKASLTELYKKHLNDPQLVVIVRSYAPSRVYVMGEVVQPGEFVSIDPNVTLLQALARAGGLKNSADMEHILVIRRQLGRPAQVISANYETATNGTDLVQDVPLTNRDVVFVSRLGIANAYLNYEQYFKQFVSPSIGLNYQLNPDNN